MKKGALLAAVAVALCAGGVLGYAYGTFNDEPVPLQDWSPRGKSAAGPSQDYVWHSVGEYLPENVLVEGHVLLSHVLATIEREPKHVRALAFTFTFRRDGAQVGRALLMTAVLKGEAKPVGASWMLNPSDGYARVNCKFEVRPRNGLVWGNVRDSEDIEVVFTPR